MATEVSFQVLRVTDRLAYDRLKEIAKTCGITVDRTAISLLSGGDFDLGNHEYVKKFEAVLALNGVVAKSIEMTLANNGRLRLIRQEASNSLKGWTDTVSVKGSDRFDELKSAELLATARKLCVAIEEGSIHRTLSEEHEKLNQSREIAIAKQSAAIDDFMVRLREFGIEATKKYSDELLNKQATLDANHKNLMDALEERDRQRTSALDAREAELTERIRKFDDRDSRHVRRAIEQEFLGKFKESGRLELSEKTGKMRFPVLCTVLVLMLLLFVGIVYYVFIDPPWERTKDLWVIVPAIIRQVLLMAGFVGAAWFLIRWQNEWLRWHADEEFRLKRLELDVYRASWVVEAVMEWKDDKGEHVPQYLIDRLSRNLFEEEKEKEEPETKANEVATAMLRAAKGAELSLGNGVKLSFGPNAPDKVAAKQND